MSVTPIQTSTVGNPAGKLIADYGNTGSKDFSSQVTDILLTVDPMTDPDYVLSGLPDQSAETGSLQFTMIQDFGAASSLQDWTYTNRGKQMPIYFSPNGAVAYTADAVIASVPIGGKVRGTGTDKRQQVSWSLRNISPAPVTPAS